MSGLGFRVRLDFPETHNHALWPRGRGYKCTQEITLGIWEI